MGSDEQALAQYQSALAGCFQFPEAHQNIALIYDRIGEFEMCRQHHKHSIEHAVSHQFKTFAILNLVNLEIRTPPYPSSVQLMELIELLKEARSLNPSDSVVEYTAGLVYEMMGRHIDAMHCFEQALIKNPMHSLSLLNIGNHHFRQNDFSSATGFYEQAIESMSAKDHNLLQAFSNLGQSLRERGLLNAALKSFQQAAEIVTNNSIDMLGDDHQPLSSPGQLFALSNLLAVGAMLCRWKHLERDEHLVADYLSLLGMQGLNARSVRAEDGYGVSLSQTVDPYAVSLFLYGSSAADLVASKIVCTTQPAHLQTFEMKKNASRAPRPADGPLRVGYLSYDWRDHPMGRLTSRLVTSHDHRRVDAHCFSYGPNDGSSARRQVQSLDEVGRFHDMEYVRSPLDAAQMVSSAELDVLVDLTTHTFNGRVDIAALKPASVVIGYLGFAGTSGCSGFDFALVDRVVVPPESAGAFSERLIYLPHSYQANNMPFEVAPCGGGREVCRLETRLISRGSLVLPLQPAYDEGRYYARHTTWACSFNANKKIEPVSFAVWMSVLLRVPSAILVLLDVTPDAKEEISAAASYHGVSMTRVLFVAKENWHDHLRRSASCDLVLDTFAYGAHTTAADMLWMHVPVLALESFGAGRMPSRVAASLVRSLRGHGGTVSSEQWHADLLGLLIVPTVKAYEEAAVRLLRRLDSIAALHEAVGHRTMRSPAFDAQLMQRDVERVYQAVHELSELRKMSSSSEVLPHLFLLAETRSSSAGMVREAQDAFLTQVRLLQRGTSDDSSGCLSRVQSSEFFTTLEQLAICTRSRSRNAEEARLWRGVGAVSRRLLLAIPSDSLEAVWLQTVAVFALFPIEEEKEQQEEQEVVVEAPQPPFAPLSDAILFPPQLTLHSQVLLTALSLQADVRAVWAAHDDRVGLVDKLRDLLAQYLALDGPAAMAIFLHAQSDLLGASDHALEQVLFDLLQPLMFEAVTYVDFLAERVNLDAVHILFRGQVAQAMDGAVGTLKVAEVAHSVEWHRLSAQEAHELLTHVMLPRLLPVRYVDHLIGATSTFRPLLRSTDNSSQDRDHQDRDLSNLLLNHAACLNLLRRPNDVNGALRYVLATLSATALRLSLEQLRNVGVALMDCGLSEAGYLFLGVATLNMQQDRFVSLAAVDDQDALFQSGLSVTIYCEEYGQSWWPGWGPSAIKQQGRGMGGSEEAVYYLAVELAALGHRVTVYADIPLSDVGVVSHEQVDGGSGRVLWKHCLHWDVHTPVDVFVAWRYSGSLAVARAARASYLWLHDLLPGNVLPPTFFSRCDGLLVQSAFHKAYMADQFTAAHADFFSSDDLKQLLVQQLATKIIITPNGITLSDGNPFVSKNDNLVFVYGSAPNRGLDLVLRSWAAIRARLPRAVLEVYYGFTGAVSRHMEGALGKQGYGEWLDSMQALLRQDGVQYFGAVDHAQLTEAYERAGFLLYPTTFQETGCITALRAMAGGAIPVTSRLRESVLFELTRGFDMGPDRALDLRTASDEAQLSQWLREEWVEAVVRASQTEASVLTAHRERMASAIRDRSTWRSTAEELHLVFLKQLAM